MSKRFVFIGLIVGFATPVFAGGPLVMNSDGTAATWDTSDSNPIELDPEAGVCGSFTNAQMVTLLTTNVEEWSGISGVDLSFSVQTGVITVDVTSSNYTTWYTTDSSSTGFLDGINPVFFDNDGTITDAIFGSGSRFTTLGGAGADSFDSAGNIIGAEAVFNCRCLSGNSSCPGGVVFTTDDLNFTMTHEIGHAIGLDHTQVNQAIADAAIDENSDTVTACADGVTVDGVTRSCDDIPAMYPIAIDSATQIVPTRDDEVALLTLYGASGWDSSLCTISGSLTDSSGNPLRCADVHAETSDPADTIAIVSGAFATATDTNGDNYTDGSGECTSNCGDFTLRGLDPAKSYTITVNPLNTASADGTTWVGSASISPCGTAQLTGIVQESIGTSSSCSAGNTVALGALTTTSTGGISSGGSGSSSSSSSGVSCALNPAATSANPFSWSSALILIFLFYGMIASLRLGMTRRTREQFLEKRQPIR